MIPNTDAALIARLRSSLDELTSGTPAVGTLATLDVPGLDTPIIPLSIAVTSPHRWKATVGAGLLAAAAIAGLVIIRPDTHRAVGERPSVTVPAAQVGPPAELPEGGVPTFEIGLPGLRVVHRSQLQSSGTPDLWNRQVWVTPQSTDDREVILNTYGANFPFDPKAQGFVTSKIGGDNGSVLEHRGVGTIDGKGPMIVELVASSDNVPTVWLQTRGLSNEELARLLAGLVFSGGAPDGGPIWQIADGGLGLVDAGPSRYGRGQLWWSRFADYQLADGSNINVSVSTGTPADRFAEGLVFDTGLKTVGERKVYEASVTVSMLAGPLNGALPPTPSSTITTARHQATWHDASGYNVQVFVDGDQANLDQVVAALKIVPHPTPTGGSAPTTVG